MKFININTKPLIKTMVVAALYTFTLNSVAKETADPLIDSFDNNTITFSGIPRLTVTDNQMGGKSSYEQSLTDGLMQVKGELVPPRGQPGWVSTVLPLGQLNENVNASEFEGLQLSVRINKGNLSISANSTEITNFDYHTTALQVPADGKFHTVSIPFDGMKRIWSQQTKLNTQTLNSLSLVAGDIQKAPFDFEIDEVRFY